MSGTRQIQTTAAFGQSEDGPSQIVESVLINPKPGHSSALEAAVKKHNDAFHPTSGLLRYISYGNRGGWYVWLMRGTYADLDARPTDEKHQKDWADTVDPHVQEYGNTTIWRLNPAISTGVDKMNSQSKYRAWAIELKQGEAYRFQPLMEKMKKVQEAEGRAFVIYNNVINMKDQPNVAIVFPFDKYAEWDQNNTIIAAYEKMYGSGSWVSFLDDWRAIVEDIDEEIREKL